MSSGERDVFGTNCGQHTVLPLEIQPEHIGRDTPDSSNRELFPCFIHGAGGTWLAGGDHPGDRRSRSHFPTRDKHHYPEYSLLDDVELG